MVPTSLLQAPKQSPKKSRLRRHIPISFEREYMPKKDLKEKNGMKEIADIIGAYQSAVKKKEKRLCFLKKQPLIKQAKFLLTCPFC